MRFERRRELAPPKREMSGVGKQSVTRAATRKETYLQARRYLPAGIVEYIAALASVACPPYSTYRTCFPRPDGGIAPA